MTASRHGTHRDREARERQDCASRGNPVFGSLGANPPSPPPEIPMAFEFTASDAPPPSRTTAAGEPTTTFPLTLPGTVRLRRPVVVDDDECRDNDRKGLYLL
jgi:hypothetical protein